jgi:hypothetical protein
MDDSNSETMTVEYRWENLSYDTQKWSYGLYGGESRARLGEVHRVIRARQSYDEPVHEYHAHAFSVKQKMVFNTRAEAQAWVTACERMN